MSGVDVLGVIRTLMSVVRTDNGNLHKEINDLLEEADEAAAAVAELVAAVRGIRELAIKASGHWDADEDMKVGKILMAMAGQLPKYDQRADALHAALAAFGGSDV